MRNPLIKRVSAHTSSRMMVGGGTTTPTLVPGTFGCDAESSNVRHVASGLSQIPITIAVSLPAGARVVLKSAGNVVGRSGGFSKTVTCLSLPKIIRHWLGAMVGMCRSIVWSCRRHWDVRCGKTSKSITSMGTGQITVLKISNCGSAVTVTGSSCAAGSVVREISCRSSWTSGRSV